MNLERGEFKALTGLGERTAGTLLKALLTRGLLASDSPQGRVRFGLPLHALRFYFPALWPEAEADEGDTARACGSRSARPCVHDTRVVA